jgi:hypothetical protein
MKTILNGLRELAGVHGTMVSNAAGQLLAYDSAAIYDADLLGTVARSIARAIESVRLTQDDWTQINSQFTEGKLLIRKLPEGQDNHSHGIFLSVVADNQLNPSFAMIALRVAVGKLQKLAETGALANLEPIAPIAASTSVAATAVERSGGTVQTAAASALSGRVPRTAEIARAGLSWSGLSSGSNLSGSGVAVVDEASAQLLTVCTKTLARSAGPMAKVFVKEAVRRVCADRPFSRDLAHALIAELARSISDPVEAAKFRELTTKATG